MELKTSIETIPKKIYNLSINNLHTFIINMDYYPV